MDCEHGFKLRHGAFLLPIIERCPVCALEILAKKIEKRDEEIEKLIDALEHIRCETTSSATKTADVALLNCPYAKNRKPTYEEAMTELVDELIEKYGDDANTTIGFLHQLGKAHSERINQLIEEIKSVSVKGKTI